MDNKRLEDPDFVKRYAEGPGRYAPGYKVMQRMAAQLIAERAGGEASVLVLGAGGGLEIEAFAKAEPGWRFTGVDPAPAMLNAARERAKACGAHADWVEGNIFDAPPGPFDAATCLLTLHFLPDDGGKLETLCAVRQRMKPDAPLVLVDLCIDKAAPDHGLRVGRYERWALNSEAPPDEVEATIERVRDVINTASPERDVALLAEAGFTGADLFYAGLSWRGWVATA